MPHQTADLPWTRRAAEDAKEPHQRPKSPTFCFFIVSICIRTTHIRECRNASLCQEIRSRNFPGTASDFDAARLMPLRRGHAACKG